jgi:hypothetical protein
MYVGRFYVRVYLYWLLQVCKVFRTRLDLGIGSCVVEVLRVDDDKDSKYLLYYVQMYKL